MSLWTDATCLDTVATANAAQMVVMRPLDEREKISPTNPLVPKVENDACLQIFARFILTKDVVARLEAFSPWDFTGNQLRAAGIEPGRALGNEGGLVHEAYACVSENAGYDVDANLLAAIAGRPAMLPGSSLAISVHGATDLSLRGVHGVIPEMARAPSGNYSPAAAQQSAVLLSQLRAIHQTASEAVDAGLAATAAANWAAARTAALAWATSWHPTRGYL